MTLIVGIEHWRLAKPFAIARGVKTEAVTVVVRVSDGKHVGIGESVPYARYGESPDDVADTVETLRGVIDGPDRAVGAPPERRLAARERLKPGAALNAIDCALWDLEAKRTGRRVAALAGLNPPATIETAVTVTLDTPDAMAAAARDAVTRLGATLLKAKVGAGAGGPDLALEAARLRAVRAAAPAARVIVDANEGWTVAALVALDPICAEIGALFIEQPLPAEQDALLRPLTLATPLCADESCHTAADLKRMLGLFRVVNLKLDKCGGLTGAIDLRAQAFEMGFQLMIGCMVAGSLATAPATLLTEGALAVDLDGPLLLAQDRLEALTYRGARLSPPSVDVWG